MIIIYLSSDGGLESIFIAGLDPFKAVILGSNVGLLVTTFSIRSLIWITLLCVQTSVIVDVGISLFNVAPVGVLSALVSQNKVL